MRLSSAGIGHYQWNGTGVDTASHRGAITAKGKTVTVFGTGVDVFYPKESSRWSEQILALAARSFRNSQWGRLPRRKTFPFAIGS
jgi:DNA processing protein